MAFGEILRRKKGGSITYYKCPHCGKKGGVADNVVPRWKRCKYCHRRWESKRRGKV